MNTSMTTPHNSWSLSVVKPIPAFLVVEPSRNTPYVCYNERDNQLTIKGNSFSDKVLVLYGSNIRLIKEHLRIHERLNLSMSFYKLNSSSIKCLFDMLGNLRSYQKLGKNISVTWNYPSEDDDLLESIKDISELLHLNITPAPIVANDQYDLTNF